MVRTKQFNDFRSELINFISDKPGTTDCKQCQIDPCAIDSAKVKKTTGPTTALCLIDTHAHTLAARAMRLPLVTATDSDNALFISDSDGDTGGAHHAAISPLADRRTVYSHFS